MTKLPEPNVFAQFRIELNGQSCYVAGMPHFPRNFSRDGLLSAMIANSRELLVAQLEFSLVHQGTKLDPITGQEPGKIHHEYPGVELRSPLKTTYNACDTTALYLIGLERLLNQAGPEDRESLRAAYNQSADAAVTYLQAHIKNELFWEFPPTGVKNYALQVTYWKDSLLPDRPSHAEPSYPVAYGLVQFQVARGIMAAAEVLRRPELGKLADGLFKSAIANFITMESFCIAKDETGRLEHPSSDELQALAYIPAQYHSLLALDAIKERAKSLKTPVGIASNPEAVDKQLGNHYHGYVVWIFEQALINYGCRKFGLTELAQVAKRCIPEIGAGQEFISIKPNIELRGDSKQLWSVAAGQYFSSPEVQTALSWL